jgi:DNA helicase II / ATP-dependent DNA helicase PcrA
MREFAARASSLYNTPMGKDSFAEAYERLNAAQKKAVDTIEGPVMVIAGPGTGKTTILTLRIANILKRTDTPPSGILAITYTDAGVKAMREKLREVIGSRAHEVGIYTFHSFAASVIAAYPDHFLHLEGFRQITEVEEEALIRIILESKKYKGLRPLGKPDAYLSSIMRTIEEAKREALMPDDVRRHAKDEIVRIQADESSISTRGATKGQLKAEAKERIAKCERTLLFADVYEEYEQRKREGMMLDFADLILELVAALKNDELLLRLLQEKYLYILVDEHQDTNDAQNLIIALIAEFFETPNIFIVGDEKQAIYRFQGASVENFLLLQKQWPGMVTIPLEANYRSHQAILDAGFSLIEHNYEPDEYVELRVKLTAGNGAAPKPIEVITGENAGAVERDLLEKLKRLTADEPESTVALITRKNRDLERAIRLLESEGIPVSSERSIDIFAHPMGALFFDLIEFLSDPSRTDALARTMVAGLWGLSLEEAAELIRELRSGKVQGIEDKLEGLRSLREGLLSDGGLGFIVTACRQSGYAALAARDPVYVEVWRGIVTLAESLARDLSLSNPRMLMEAMLAYRKSSESKTVKVPVGAPTLPIRAMTAHGSKGLEFDYVFIPYATEEAWVTGVRGASFVLPQKRALQDDIRDTRRLFYVALTRARKHLTVYASLEEGDGKPLTPLRFLSELDPATVRETVIPRIDAALPETSPDTQRTSKEKITDFAKHRLLTSGLSVTALNHFLEDPEKFLYESILKLPQPPSASAEKGSAMHFAIDCVWKLTDKAVPAIEKEIVRSVTEYLEGSLLRVEEKEILRHELIEAAPRVAEALESHFNSPGTVFTEHWVETVFEGVYGGERVRIPLHGKLDAILDRGHEIAVFDYKTRKGMSAAEAKGETKNSNGNYFRQLAFYKKLLQGDGRWRTKEQNLSLVFISPDDKGRCPILTLPVGKSDIETLDANIQSVIDYVWEGRLGKTLRF